MGELFNLACPPGFRGLDPNKSITTYHRHLPHWRQEGATYFVTFRLGDALPREKVDYLKRLRDHWFRTHPAPNSNDAWESLHREMFRWEDARLDEGYGACHFRDPRFASQLEDSLTHFHTKRYFMACWVVMPNHCHLLVRPFDGWKLETILQGIKGVVARRLNAKLKTVGSVWQEESYDRIVRDESHLWNVIQYIGRNPLRAGIPPEFWRRWIEPSWQAAGWCFVDTAE